MPAKEISMTDAIDAIAGQARYSAHRLRDIATTLESLGKHLDGPLFEMVKIQVVRLRDEATSLDVAKTGS